MIDLNSVLLELAGANEIPTASVLDGLVKRYPEFAKDITEFAIELATDPTLWGAKPETPSTSRAGRAVSHFFDRLHSLQPDVVVVDPFPREPSTLRALATELGTNPGFLSRVWNRAIEPETIPPPFTARLSKKLKTPESAICAFLAQPMGVSPEMRHKADGKPSAGGYRQSFDEAARISGLTAEQIAELKKPL